MLNKKEKKKKNKEKLSEENIKKTNEKTNIENKNGKSENCQVKLKINKEKKEKFEKNEISLKDNKEDHHLIKVKNDTLNSNSELLNTEKNQSAETQISEESNKIVEIKDLPPEQYYGNLEYKLKLIHTSNDRIEGLATQMKFRLQEGQGECYYMIGVEDSGNPLGLNEEELEISLKTLKTISEKLGAKFCILKEHQGKVGKFAEVMMKVENFIHDKMEIKIGLIGEESSGKSSIVILFLCLDRRPC